MHNWPMTAFCPNPWIHRDVLGSLWHFLIIGGFCSRDECGASWAAAPAASISATSTWPKLVLAALSAACLLCFARVWVPGDEPQTESLMCLVVIIKLKDTSEGFVSKAPTQIVLIASLSVFQPRTSHPVTCVEPLQFHRQVTAEAQRLLLSLC